MLEFVVICLLPLFRDFRLLLLPLLLLCSLLDDPFLDFFSVVVVVEYLLFVLVFVVAVLLLLTEPNREARAVDVAPEWATTGFLSITLAMTARPTASFLSLCDEDVRATVLCGVVVATFSLTRGGSDIARLTLSSRRDGGGGGVRELAQALLP